MPIMKKLFLFLLFVILAAQANAQMDVCQDSLYKEIKFAKKQITVCNKKIDVEIADNESLRSVGLMCRDKMDDDKGMLFIFESPLVASFWMKNTKIPLSIAFFSRGKKLLNIDDMQALDEKGIHTSRGLALYALEMNLHWFSKNKIKPGCRLVIH
jgi:uncharacterized membrane protein (UPF0127 family)